MATQVEVLNIDGSATGSLDLPDWLFESKISTSALHRAVVTYEANQRQGNASTQTRSEVKLTGRKHHRQKGTGRARRGSARSPLLRGGGVAFGPKPRSYYSELPKSLKRLAFKSALSLKRESNDVKVVDDFDFPEPSTKSFAGVIQACGLEGRKVLVVTAESVPVLVKSCRNLQRVQIRPVGTLGTYDVMAAESVLFTRRALDELSERWSTNQPAPASADTAEQGEIG